MKFIATISGIALNGNTVEQPIVGEPRVNINGEAVVLANTPHTVYGAVPVSTTKVFVNGLPVAVMADSLASGATIGLSQAKVIIK